MSAATATTLYKNKAHAKTITPIQLEWWSWQKRIRATVPGERTSLIWLFCLCRERALRSNSGNVVWLRPYGIGVKRFISKPLKTACSASQTFRTLWNVNLSTHNKDDNQSVQLDFTEIPQNYSQSVLILSVSFAATKPNTICPVWLM